MGAWGLVAAALAVGQVANGGGAQAPSTLTLQVVGPSQSVWERFLVERMRETWNLQLTILAPPTEGEAALGEPGATPAGVWVAVQAHAANLWTAKVGLGPELLTLRSLEVRDPTEATLTLWLLLKSTIDRALKQLPPPEPETLNPPATERAHGPSPSPTPASTPPAPAAPTGSSPDPRSRPEVGASSAPAPAGGHPEGLSLGAVATAYLEVPRLPAVGAAMRVAYTWSFVHAMAELGYRYAPGPEGLQLHAVPLLVAVAAELGDVVRVGVGPLAAAELKIPVSLAGAAADVGADVGGFALARVFLRSGVEISMRFAVVWRLARLRVLYRDASGAERQLREKAYTSTLSMGVMWP